MIRIRTASALIAAALLAAPGMAQAQQRAADLFQRALRVERVQGDLEEAIRLYQRVVEMEDRALAARALLRIAESYERLGRAGAEDAYRRLVTEFAEQTTEASVARNRLAALVADSPDRLKARNDAAGADRVNLRLVWPDPARITGWPTPDGRGLTFVDWNPHGRLGVRDLATGETRTLKSEGDRGYPLGSSVSNDGRTVAFQWIPGPWQPQLRMVSIDGTGERLLIENGTLEIDYITPFDWTPDDRGILVEVAWMDDHSSIGIVSVADGSMRTLRSFTPGEGVPARLTLSPDGHWVAFDLVNAGTGRADIFVLATDGTAERQVVSHPGYDTRPIWSPDGQHLVFVSDRGGSVDLWAVRVSGGTAQGDPFPIRRDVGPGFVPMGFTADGSLFFRRNAGGGDIFAVDFDADSGRVIGTPERVVPVYQGYNNGPRWSGDGSRLAYASRRTRILPGDGASLIVRDEAAGSESEPAPGLRLHAQESRPAISPDGTLIAVKGHMLDDPAGVDGMLRLIDLRDGSVRTLREPGPSERCAFCPVVFSKDGRALFYSTVIPAAGVEACSDEKPECVEYRGLIRHDLATGSHDRVFPWDLDRPNRAGSWALSPDEKRIVTLYPDTTRNVTVVRVGTLGDGTQAEIASFRHKDLGCEPDHSWNLPVWTEAGRILFVCELPRAPGEKRMHELMSVPVTGGTPSSTGLVMEALRHISIQADGRLGFAAGPTHRHEVWIMSGLASELADSR